MYIIYVHYIYVHIIYTHIIYIYLSYTHYIYMYIPIIHNYIYIKIIHINALHTHIYIYILHLCAMSGACLWGSCAGSTWFVADLIARGNSWRRRMTSWDGWTFARIHWAYLPMPSGWLSRNSVVWLSHSAWNFRSICSIYIYSVYTHTYCTHLYGIYIYMYTYVYIPYLRIETHGSWVSIFWTCTSIWWLNSRQLVADFRGCTWGNSAELPGPLVDD